MDFRTDDGKLDLGSPSEIWIEHEDNPLVGVLSKEKELCYFSFYTQDDSKGPLYLCSFVPEEIIQDMRNGRVDLLTGFSYYTAHIFKEVVVDGKIEVKEVSYFDLLDEELPEEGTYLNDW